MHKKHLVFSAVTLMTVFAFVFNGKETLGSITKYSFSSGSPGGRTNSPGDGQVCTFCHMGSALNSGNSNPIISSDDLINGYLPGETYTINVALTQAISNRIGFEVTSENLSDSSKVGTIIITDTERTRLANFEQSITHELEGTFAMNNENYWSFDWIAPMEAIDTIVFYGAFNVANGNGTTTGDKIYTTTFTATQNTTDIESQLSTVSPIEIFPIPSANIVNVKSNKILDKIELLDVNGKTLIEKKSDFEFLDVTEISFGLYFLKITSGNEIFLEKIIVGN